MAKKDRIMKKLLHLFLLLFFVGQQNVEAQTAPSITYYSPNVFTKGQIIGNLNPNNLGGEVSNKPLVTTFAGSGQPGSADGAGINASFNYPVGTAIDLTGNLYVVDRDNIKIRKITPEGIVSTFAGTGQPGSADGAGINASFNAPYGVATDSIGNVYVADSGNNKIRKITPEGIVSTFAGNGQAGSTDGAGINASFNAPQGIATDAIGNVYVADTENHKIRKITPEGMVSTFAGTGNIGAVDGIVSIASFNGPQGITIDVKNNSYVSDTDNHKIRKITPEGMVSTFAGSGQPGSTEGAGINASFYSPRGITIDALQNIYIADRNNLKIRKITPEGIVSTFAGSGQPGEADGNALTATFIYPSGVAVDATGQLYISDLGSNKIRKVTYGFYNINPVPPLGLVFNIIDGSISGTPNRISPTTAYTVTATNEFGSNSFDVVITVNDVAPNISYTISNTFIAEKEATPLLPINIGGEVQSFSIYPNLPSGLNLNTMTGEITGVPLITSDKSVYTVTAINTGGVSIFDITISVIEQTKTKDLLISQLITPNGDGINDTWMFSNLENYLGIEVRVYNRWGKEVYHSTNYKNDWDGAGLPGSTYYYVATIKEEKSNFEKNGWFYITK
jgi:gliding motility-associated-like protein